MSTPMILACLWLVVANVAAMLPSRRKHWPAAWVLIALGLPLFVWLWGENGMVMALLFLLTAASVLRWPVLKLARWVAGIVERAGTGK
jgi:hypothetical protein